jgi:hypothetical protein
VLSLAMVPGALNRADGGHILLYGAGFFLLALLSFGRLYRWSFAVIFCALVPYTGYYVYHHDLRIPQRLTEWAPGAPFGSRWRAWNAGARQEERDLRQIDQALAGSGPLCAPFGDTSIMLILWRRGALQSEYFTGMANVYTPDDLRRKIAGLEACTGVVVQRRQMAPPVDRVDARIAEIGRFVRHLFLYPFPPKIDRTQMRADPEDPVREYCASHFQLRSELAMGFGLYTRVAP